MEIPKPPPGRIINYEGLFYKGFCPICGSSQKTNLLFKIL